MKTLLREHSLWLIILLLQLLLTFGLYVVWSTEHTLQDNPTSKALEQNVTLKMQQVSEVLARSLIEQQQTALQGQYLQRARTNQTVHYLALLSAGILVLLVIAVVILVKTKPRHISLDTRPKGSN